MVNYAAEFGAFPDQFDFVLTEQASSVAITSLPENAHFLPANHVAFTQTTLAETRLERWQVLITDALGKSTLAQLSQDTALLMVLPYVDVKHSQLKRQLIDSVAEILPAWTNHPNTEYFLMGSAGFYQALRHADKLLNTGQESVVIGAVDSWATEQGILKFVSRYTDYASVVLPASEGAIFIQLSRQSKGIEVLGCGMDAVVDFQAPNGLIALLSELKALQDAPMAYLATCYSGGSEQDQVAQRAISAIPGLYDANTHFISPQIKQGDTGACYSLLQFLISYHKFENKIWQGRCLQIDTSSLPFVGAALYGWQS